MFLRHLQPHEEEVIHATIFITPLLELLIYKYIGEERLAHMSAKSLPSCLTLMCPWDSSGKNTGVGCHALPPGDLPDPGMEPASPAAPALQVNSSPLSHQGSSGEERLNTWERPSCPFPLNFLDVAF